LSNKYLLVKIFSISINVSINTKIPIKIYSFNFLKNYITIILQYLFLKIICIYKKNVIIELYKMKLGINMPDKKQNKSRRLTEEQKSIRNAKMKEKKELNERKEISQAETGVLNKQDNKLAEFYLKTMFLDVISKSKKSSCGAEEVMIGQYNDSIGRIKEEMQIEKGTKKVTEKELDKAVKEKLGTPQEFMMTFAYTDEIQAMYKSTFSEEYEALQKEIHDRKKAGLIQNEGMQNEDAILTIFKEKNPDIQKQLEGDKVISNGIQDAMEFLIKNPTSILKGVSMFANPGMFAAMQGVTKLLQTDTGKNFTKSLGDRYTDVMENSPAIQSLKQRNPAISRLAKKFKESKVVKIGGVAIVAAGLGVYGLAANDVLPPSIMAELPTISSEGFNIEMEGIRENTQIPLDVSSDVTPTNPSIDESISFSQSVPSDVLMSLNESIMSDEPLLFDNSIMSDELSFSQSIPSDDPLFFDNSTMSDELSFDPIGNAVEEVFPSMDGTLSMDEIEGQEFNTEFAFNSLSVIPDGIPNGVQLDDALTYDPVGDAVDAAFPEMDAGLNPEIMAAAAASVAVDVTASVAIEAIELAVHEVSSGDTLWDIAEANLPEGATNTEIANYVNDIAEHNNIENPDLIYPEQKFELPLANGVNPALEIETCDMEVPVVEAPVVEAPVVEMKNFSILDLKNQTYTDLANAGEFVLSDSVNPEKAASLISDNAVAEFKAQNLSRDLGYSRTEMRGIYKELDENITSNILEKITNAKESGLPMDLKNMEIAVTAKDGSIQTVSLSQETSKVVIAAATQQTTDELALAQIEQNMRNDVNPKEGFLEQKSGSRRPRI
jgi:hypothetical protein